MEVELNHANFWLPSEFLNHKDMSILNGFGSYRLNSDLCSPAESVMGSTETESDEEDYLNELTRKLANSALDDDSNFSNKLTLCGCKQVDGCLPVNGNRNQIGAQPPRRIPSLNPQFHQIQMKQHLMMKQQQQMIKQRQRQYEELARQSRVKNGGRMVAAPLSVWPTLQQSQQKPRGLGMRAVFLENPNIKRESTGTGVFLPRQIGAPIETHKKKDAEMRYRNSGVMLKEQQRQHVEKDILLPQEWTY